VNIDLYLEYLAGATGPGGMEQKADQTSIAGTQKLGLCDIEELEVLLRICDFLAPRDQANLACACRSFGGKVRWTESDTYVETCSVVEQSARRWVRSRQLQRSWLQQRHLIEHATAEVINECKNGTTTWRLKSLLKHAQLNINGVDGVDDDVRPKINALSWSAHRNNVGTMRTLLRAGADLNISAWNGATPLMIAAWNGSNEAVQWLLDQGADWRKVHPKTGKNALAMALERGHSEATSLLATWLEVHGTLEEKLRWKFYELMRAAEQGQMEEVARLLEYGDLDVNATEAMYGLKATDAMYGRFRDVSPIGLVAGENHTDVMAVLVRAGADLNISAWNGATPLMIAAWNGSNEAVQWLLDQGADWRKVHPKTGKNALAMALERGHSEATSLLATWLEVHGTLEEKLRWKFYELMRAAEQGQMEEVARLLEYGDLDVNAADNRGFMVLHAAVARNDVSMMERVVKAGADINMKNGKARTPLMVAVRNDSNEAAQWLLERGADWMIQSADGEDAMQYAKQVGSSVVRLLGQWVASNPDRPQPVLRSGEKYPSGGRVVRTTMLWRRACRLIGWILLNSHQKRHLSDTILTATDKWIRRSSVSCSPSSKFLLTMHILIVCFNIML
jgi:ankyrin repeat protein